MEGIPEEVSEDVSEEMTIGRLLAEADAAFARSAGEAQQPQKQRNKALTLAHAQTIHYTSN